MQKNTNKQSHNSFDLSPQLRKRCIYPRLTRSKGVVLMIDAGYFIQQECERAFRQCGWQIVKIPLYPQNDFIEKLLLAVITLRPDLLFTVNHLGFDCEGRLTELIESIEMPVVSWFVDSPAYILLDHIRNASPYVMTPIWERNYLSFLKGFGFKHSFHLPLAGDMEVFYKPKRPVKHKYPIAFVGDSMVYAVNKWRGLCSSIPEADQIINDAANILVSKNKQNSAKVRDVEKHDHFEDILSSLDRENQLTISSAIVLEATQLYRMKLVNKLDSTELHIFGDIEGWRQYVPSHVQLHDSVDYYTELPQIYGQTAVNLNCTSFQMPTAVNQRVFDVPLAGGFLLTDDQDDLRMLFDSEDVATYSDVDELTKMASWYLARDSLRSKMIRNARARISIAHTYKHRLEEIINRARMLFADSQISCVCQPAIS
ncbi:glycosyltransferase [bacterium]|nr:glycosyltransferase [bacterium]